jgi:hypothetical protein
VAEGEVEVVTGSEGEVVLATLVDVLMATGEVELVTADGSVVSAVPVHEASRARPSTAAILRAFMVTPISRRSRLWPECRRRKPTAR